MAADAVLAYATAVTEEVVTASDGSLRAAYLHGSAVLGGWHTASDVDMLFVAADTVAGSTLARMATILAARSDQAGGCPGRGLECSVVTATAAAVPSVPWPYLLHVVAEPGGCRIQGGADSPGDPDLLMHYAVCRADGRAFPDRRCDRVQDRRRGGGARPRLRPRRADHARPQTAAGSRRETAA